MTFPYTKTPNAILEALPTMHEGELKLTALLIRATYGWHRREVRMTYDEMMEACGIGSRATMATAVKAVDDRGFFDRGTRSRWTAVVWYGDESATENSTPTVLNGNQDSTESVLNEPYYSTESVLNYAECTDAGASNSTESVLENSTESVLPSYKRKEREEKERGESARAREDTPPSPSPDPTLIDGAEERWRAAQLAVRQWARRRHLRQPDPDNANDKTDYFRPALELARERPHLDEHGLFDLLWQAYEEMRAAGLTPRRLGPLVDQILAPPITPRPYTNGRNGQPDATALIGALWQGVE